MDDEKKLTSRDRTPVWIDRRIVRAAKEIAAREGSTISDLVEKLLRKPMAKKHDQTFADTGNPVG